MLHHATFTVHATVTSIPRYKTFNSDLARLEFLFIHALKRSVKLDRHETSSR